ncbi:MAG: DUF2784 domain-containing protein [Gammaproteobacteria bacterium]|nr:DUF2784 domain-containing protein [Gammaproteobacteria bacterium]
MDSSTWTVVAADAILLLHALFVVFVVLGLVLILAGWWRGWRWVHNPWFRLAHLVAIAVVAIQSWFGLICPLTTLEMSLRARAGAAVYPGSFIAHWLEIILYYQAPAWIFILLYTIFAALVGASWYLVRPSSFSDFRGDHRR